MTKLTSGLVSEPADPTLAAMGDTTREPAQPEPGQQLVTMFVTSGVAVSSGERTPGVVHVPPAEAADLAFLKVAVYGDQPPRGFSDGGQPGGALPLPRTFTRNLPGTPRAGLRG